MEYLTIKSHGAVDLAPVVPGLDSAIHWIKLFPMENAICFAITYLPDSDLSTG